ncbi:hypothetical protein [Streptomyces sp. NPDC058466]|uniref:hypothetical protein n=1 Tax=Streptomyces sp. NPDC058466 TaxID=3346512 RepID=UPI00365A13FC
MTTNPLTDQQLTVIEARAGAATPGPWEEHDDYGPHFYAYLRGSYLRGVGTLNFGDGEDAEADREFVKHAREDVDALLAEVRRLRARVTELEGPAVEARAALAALCYDLEDPGTAALGALYLISQATTGVEATRDDAVQALAQHDAEVLRKAAQVLEETDRDDDAVNLLYLLADGKVPATP